MAMYCEQINCLPLNLLEVFKKVNWLTGQSSAFSSSGGQKKTSAHRSITILFTDSCLMMFPWPDKCTQVSECANYTLQCLQHSPIWASLCLCLCLCTLCLCLCAKDLQTHRWGTPYGQAMATQGSKWGSSLLWSGAVHKEKH